MQYALFNIKIIYSGLIKGILEGQENLKYY